MFQQVPHTLRSGDEDRGEGMLPPEKWKALHLDGIDTFSKATICSCSDRDLYFMMGEVKIEAKPISSSLSDHYY